VEWNNDSYDDVIVGDRNGFVSYFRRNSDGTLTTQPQISCAGTTIDVGANSAPVCVDWNEDGKIDLLVGNETGNIALYINDNGDSQPLFNSFVYLTSNGSNINHYRACPQVYDLNGDGKKDLLVGADNAYLYYYENTGTNSSPAFSGSVQLQSAGAPIHEYYGLRLWVNDWNGNGSPDLLTSDYNGFVRVYLAQPTGSGDTWSGISGGFAFALGGATGSPLLEAHVELPQASTTSVRVYSTDGRLVREVSAGLLAAGAHVLQLDLSGLPAGAYMLACNAGQWMGTDRTILVD
jgi:hypothetical protein